MARSLRILVLVSAALTLSVVVAAPHADAGGSWMSPVADRYEPGDQVTLVGYTGPGAFGSVSDGPFFGYLFRELDDRSGPHPRAIPLPVGQLETSETGESGSFAVRVTITFTMPSDAPAGRYLLHYCNAGCEEMLGDLLGGAFFVGVDAGGPIAREWPSTGPERLNLDAQLGAVVEVQPATWDKVPTRIDGEAQQAVFWTGKAVVVLETTNGGYDVAGEQWDPATNDTNRIADSGLTWRWYPATVWTGSEIFIAGGSSGPALNQFASAYNPRTDTWRPLADPPGEVDGWENSVGGPAVWTGTEMIVWNGNLAYDPAADSWRTISSPPFQARSRPATVWTGSRLIVWGGCHIENAQCDELNSGLRGDGAVYDVATDTWTALPTSPLPGAVHMIAGWTGSEALFVITDPGEGTKQAAAAYNPSTRSWREIASLPLSVRRGAAGVWADGRFVVWGGGNGLSDKGENDGAAYDPATNQWSPLPAGPGPGRSLHTMIEAGDRIYISATRTVSPPLQLELQTTDG